MKNTILFSLVIVLLVAVSRWPIPVAWGRPLPKSLFGFGQNFSSGGNITFINSLAQNLGSSSGGTTSALNTTGANFIAACVSFWTSGTAVNFSSSPSNTWTKLTPYGQADLNPQIVIFYAENAAVGTTQTFTSNTAYSYPSVTVMAFSGVKTTSSFDVQNGNSLGLGSFTIQPGSITPSLDHEMVISCISGYTGVGTDSFSINSSYIQKGNITSVGSQSMANGGAYIIQGTKSATNPTWTDASNNTHASSIASFKAQ